ncbi:hypothetical protein [Shewanella aestuarii]|uniref:Uncharacterized protein n=1 Tax=Shewanella aestuarii TaxID=1028752 RepID=A0A6G9QQK2_9GAMM|nr:hypothetical protein [Shewanella aestuarii]QIR16345.1 hypothetical protein HBH39_17825 [Shewanella aestuarii]
MGFFSFKTCDSKESIANIHSNHPNAGRTVYLLQPNGERPIQETAYQGYGDFGHVDAYAWLAKFNATDVEHLDLVKDAETLRHIGIAMTFEEPEKIKYPLKFSFNEKAVYELLAASEDCEYQGYFYHGIAI